MIKKTVSAKWKLISTKKIKNKDELLEVLLKNRGINEKEKEVFLSPKDPYNLSPNDVGIKKTDIENAIERIKQAIKKKELVVVYGDYDADGITGTALLWETLYSLGAKVMPFIPHREKHGYGLNKKGINDILQAYRPIDLKTLIITVDNGIVAFEGAEYCREKGIDLIISDHHQKKILNIKNQKSKLRTQKKYLLPKAEAVVWSDKICGSGVAWFLAKELYQTLKDKSLLGFKRSNTLELAAIGTITDMMPLVGINRSLVYFGLAELNRSRRTGIKALVNEAVLKDKELGTYEINFMLGPRLNAMGRMAEALDSLRLLCTKDYNKAEKLAKKLGMTNVERQNTTQDNLELAISLVGKNKLYKNKVIFLAHEDFNAGVIGLVAGRLVEKYYRPAVMVAKMDGMGKGSVRSVKGVDIIKMLRCFDNYFVDLGGHPMAAGFNIELKMLAKLQKELALFAEKEIDENLLRPEIKIDCGLAPELLDWPLFSALEKLKPFGMGNPKPLFLAEKVNLAEFRRVGRDGKHLKIKFQVPGDRFQTIDGIAFGLGDMAAKLSLEKPVDVAYFLDKNEWNGAKTLQMRVRGIKG